MAILAVMLAGLVFIAAVIVVAQAQVIRNLRTQTAKTVEETRQKAALEVENANRTVVTLVKLLQSSPQSASPDRLIAVIGETLAKIVVGGPGPAANEPTEPESEAYYPDVEFDEWLGHEGIPPTAGWWSPPNNGERNTPISLPPETPNMG